MLTLDEIREKLLHRYDPEDILDLLGIDADQLLDRFEDILMIKASECEEALEEWE